MLSLFTGLRSAYSTLQSTHDRTACEVTIPPAFFYDSFDTEYALKDVQILVDKMGCDEQGDLVLSVPRCSVTVNRGSSDSAPSEKASINLGLILKVKPPVGKAAEELLACGLSSMKRVGSELDARMQKLSDEGKRSFSDIMDVSFDQVSVTTAGSASPYNPGCG